MKRKFTKYPSKITASRESEYYAKKAKEEAEENERVRSNLEIAQKYAPILSREGYDGESFVTWVEEEHYYDDLRDPDNLRGVIWNFVLGYICERDDYGGSAQEEEADEVTDKILSQGNGVDACDRVTASSRYEPDDSGIESYQAQCRSKKDNVLCIKHSNNRIDRYRFHSIDGLGDVFEPETGSGNWWTSYIVTPDNKLLSWQFNGRYTPVDATYGEDFWVETASEENIESATDAKYFANMVSASSEDTYRYLIRGFYDIDRKGLAEDAWADTISEVDDIVNEYANKGYYLEVKNLETGTAVEFTADDWFDSLSETGFSGIPGALS